MSRKHTAPDRMTPFSQVPDIAGGDDSRLAQAVLQDRLDSQPTSEQIEARLENDDAEAVLREWLDSEHTTECETLARSSDAADTSSEIARDE